MCVCVWTRARVCVCVCVCDIVYNYQQKVCFFRWDLEDVDQLPKYMFVYLNSFKTVIIEIEEELSREGRLHYKHYLVESVCAFFTSPDSVFNLLYTAKKFNDI